MFKQKSQSRKRTEHIKIISTYKEVEHTRVAFLVCVDSHLHRATAMSHIWIGPMPLQSCDAVWAQRLEKMFTRTHDHCIAVPVTTLPQRIALHPERAVVARNTIRPLSALPTHTNLLDAGYAFATSTSTLHHPFSVPPPPSPPPPPPPSAQPTLLVDWMVRQRLVLQLRGNPRFTLRGERPRHLGHLCNPFFCRGVSQRPVFKRKAKATTHPTSAVPACNDDARKVCMRSGPRFWADRV